MRRFATVLVLLALTSGVGRVDTTAGGTTDLEARLARALAAPGIAPRRTGALAIDLRTGETVYARNAGRSLLPASTEKLSVAFAALRDLGPGYRFRTDVVGVGSLEAGAWNGDLFMVGHGDPTLALSDVGTLARRIRASGIRRIDGRVFGDESYFDSRRDAPGWKPSYLGIESRPLSALSVIGAVQRGTNGSAASAAYVGRGVPEMPTGCVAGSARGALPMVSTTAMTAATTSTAPMPTPKTSRRCPDESGCAVRRFCVVVVFRFCVTPLPHRQAG